MRKRYVFYLTDDKADLRERLDNEPNRSRVILLALEAWYARVSDLPAGDLDIEAIRQVVRQELARVTVLSGGTAPAQAASTEDPEVTDGMTTLLGTYEDLSTEEDSGDDLPNERGRTEGR